MELLTQKEEQYRMPLYRRGGCRSEEERLRRIAGRTWLTEKRRGSRHGTERRAKPAGIRVPL